MQNLQKKESLYTGRFLHFIRNGGVTQSQAIWAWQELQCGSTKGNSILCRFLQIWCDFRCWLLCKTGIDVKYSTGTIEWFDNILPLRGTCYLQIKDLAMAETIEIQLENDFLAWIGMIQPSMHLKFWMQNMKRSLLICHRSTWSFKCTTKEWP